MLLHRWIKKLGALGLHMKDDGISREFVMVI